MQSNERNIKVIGYIKPYLPRIIYGFLIKILGTLMDLCIPWILAHIIDAILPTKNIDKVVLWGGMMIVCSLLAWGGNILANRMASSVARDTTRKIRHDLFEKISYLSNRNVDHFTTSSLISRMTSDTYIVHQTIGMIQRLGVRAPIMLVGGILITLFLDPVLTLVMAAILPIAFLISVFISRKGVKLFKIVQAKSDKMLTVVRENVAGVRVIKALSKADYEKKRFEKINFDLTDKEKSAQITMSIINPLISVLLNLGLVIVIIIGAIRVNSGTSEIGKIIAFMNYFTIILQSIMAITRMLTMLSKASASSTRIEEVLNCPPELYELTSKYIKKNTENPFIEFNDVTFKYDTGRFKLKNINFTINKGETFGIIGATGSGKSTIIQTLIRFYDIESGSIKIEGVDIRDYSTKELRSKFGVVFQYDTLFKDTIGENIRFGRSLNEDQIKNASTYAMAYDFINEQGGFSAPVSIKGANLSGGQKQRLLISRALAGSPEILILDDSSSALDYKTDAAIRQHIKQNYKDTTKIIVTQRISSVMNAENIAVMDNGKIIGIGNHEYLKENCPLYREIELTQIGGKQV